MNGAHESQNYGFFSEDKVEIMAGSLSGVLEKVNSLPSQLLLTNFAILARLN